jgi:hypothetical protein
MTLVNIHSGINSDTIPAIFAFAARMRLRKPQLWLLKKYKCKNVRKSAIA